MSRVAEIVGLMRGHGGSYYAAMEPAALTAVVAREWQLGQWLMITDRDNHLLGWLSYYCLDWDSIERIREHGFHGCIRQRLPLNGGDHLYLANVVVAPDAPANTFSQLYRATVASFPRSLSLSAWLTNRSNRHPNSHPRFYHKKFQPVKEPHP